MSDLKEDIRAILNTSLPDDLKLRGIALLLVGVKALDACDDRR